MGNVPALPRIRIDLDLWHRWAVRVEAWNRHVKASMCRCFRKWARWAHDADARLRERLLEAAFQLRAQRALENAQERRRR